MLRSVERILKTKDILNCHSPILTCLLVCEFITQIGELSVQHQTKCSKIVQQLCKFCSNIQEANPDEKYIKFLMTQKECKGRSAYQIAADNNYFEVLKSPELGTIVQKMLNGRLSHDGIMAFSSISKYVSHSAYRTLDPFENFETFDQNKTYFHQLSLWTESCSLRYAPESTSTVILIIIYNLFIYFLVNRDFVMSPIESLDSDLKFYLYIYIFWAVSIALNIPLQMLFCYLSERRYRIDKWGWIEIAMLISSLCLLIDTKNIFPTGNPAQNNTDTRGIVYTDNAFLFRAIILSINDVFVWLRVTGIFLTFKDVGPLIRMVYLLSITSAVYLVVFALFVACSTAIYTAIFYSASDQYAQFSVTVTTIFGMFINNLNAFDFDYYKYFGAFATLLFVTLSGLMLINLLIAMLSNVYSSFSNEVDAAHRSVLIGIFRRYKWNRNYGYLMFLTTPLNILNFLFLPFHIFCKKSFNDIACRTYFLLCYLPIIMLIQFFYLIFLLPLSYLKGIVYMFYHQYYTKNNLFIKVYGIFKWVIAGLPFLLFVVFRDFMLELKTVFKKIDVVSIEKKRIKQSITNEDIQIFLQFIHARGHEEHNDLHTIFLDYLRYDQEKKAESNQKIKEKSSYIQKLISAGSQGKKKKYQNASIILYSHKNTVKASSSGKLGEQDLNPHNIIKKNLIIIEMLENFLIDDGSDNFIVDIKKLKMLLPKTMNINNSYIKRIVHTDINSLTKAVNKLKNKTNRFMQNKMLNKIVGATVRLDHIVDNDRKKEDPLHLEKNRKFHHFDVDENEDDFYSELHLLVQKIGFDIKDTIARAFALEKCKQHSCEKCEMSTRLCIPLPPVQV